MPIWDWRHNVRGRIAPCHVPLLCCWYCSPRRPSRSIRWETDGYRLRDRRHGMASRSLHSSMRSLWYAVTSGLLLRLSARRRRKPICEKSQRQYSTDPSSRCTTRRERKESSSAGNSIDKIASSQIVPLLGGSAYSVSPILYPYMPTSHVNLRLNKVPCNMVKR